MIGVFFAVAAEQPIVWRAAIYGLVLFLGGCGLGLVLMAATSLWTWAVGRVRALRVRIQIEQEQQVLAEQQALDIRRQQARRAIAGWKQVH